MADNRQQSIATHSYQAATRSSTQAASDMARQGAEAIHRAGDVAGEATRRGVQAMAEGQRQFAQDAAERFADVSHKAAQAVQDNIVDLRSLAVLPNAARGGLQDVQQGVTGLFEGMVRTNVRATQELFRLYDVSAVIELQQRFAREYLNLLMQGTATLVRATRRTADETLRLLEQQIEQRRQQADEDQRHQHAAE